MFSSFLKNLSFRWLNRKLEVLQKTYSVIKKAFPISRHPPYYPSSLFEIFLELQEVRYFFCFLWLFGQIGTTENTWRTDIMILVLNTRWEIPPEHYISNTKYKKNSLNTNFRSQTINIKKVEHIENNRWLNLWLHILVDKLKLEISIL